MIPLNTNNIDEWHHHHQLQLQHQHHRQESRIGGRAGELIKLATIMANIANRNI